MEDRYENLKDIETAINTKPIKEVVKHIDFTECLDKITLESPWTKKNFENNRIIDSELLIADNFQDHFQVVNDIIEKEEDILFYICTWYKEMEDKVRYYSCSGDLIKQRFYDEQVGEVIRKTFTTIYPEGIKKVEVVKLNKIIEKYLGYLPSFCLKPAPWELPTTNTDTLPFSTNFPLLNNFKLDYLLNDKDIKFKFDMLLSKLFENQYIEFKDNCYVWNKNHNHKEFAYFILLFRKYNLWSPLHKDHIPWEQVTKLFSSSFIINTLKNTYNKQKREITNQNQSEPTYLPTISQQKSLDAIFNYAFNYTK